MRLFVVKATRIDEYNRASIETYSYEFNLAMLLARVRSNKPVGHGFTSLGLGL
jgi:hypothetical protein